MKLESQDADRFSIQQRLVADASVNRCQVRPVLYQGQHVQPGEIILSLERSVDLPHEFQVFSRVHSPPQVTIIGVVVYLQHSELALILI